MRNMWIGKQAWDSSNSNNWNRPATLNTYLNSTYYNSLTSTAQSQIVSKSFSIGSVEKVDNDLLNTINDENSKTWNGKIALATASEYIRSNSDQENCGNMNLIQETMICGNTTWMHNSTWWTLSPVSSSSSQVFAVYVEVATMTVCSIIMMLKFLITFARLFISVLKSKLPEGMAVNLIHLLWNKMKY